MPDLSARPEAIKAVPLRHPGRWVAAIVVLAITAQVVGTIVTAPDLHWDVVSHYLFQGYILGGVVLTLELTVISMVIGVGLGMLLAIKRL
jgi:polar amino acid transport system permease protein